MLGSALRRLIAVGLCLPGLGWAALEPASPRFSYLTLGPSVVLEDDERQSGLGTGARFSIGHRFHERWGYEVGTFFHDFDVRPERGGADWREYGAKFSAMYYYIDSRDWMPYFALGGGVMRSRDRLRLDASPGQSGRSTDPFADIGVGLFRLFQVGGVEMGLRADYRYRYLDPSDIGGVNVFQEHVLSLDWVLPFGGLRPRVAALTQAADRDGDGVPDTQDRCPDTPPGVPVDTSGCPLDSDGDGVPDYRDDCPDTPPGTVVDPNGCPMAPPPAASPPAPALEGLEPIAFPFDSAELTDFARAQLVPVISALQALVPLPKLELVGHTDGLGDAVYNERLARARAEAVKAYLVAQGLPAEPFTIRSAGAREPRASNDTEAGRALNRRVEIRRLP